MSDALEIRRMSLDDLCLAADWAAAEGWNPGLEDVSAFHGVDPDGFLMGWLGDVPVTAISVVRHSDTFGFLGFYLCHPDHRGKGYGWATWQAGIAHLGDRTVGLDGVPAQEENYARSGFKLIHHTKRYAGRVLGRKVPDCRLAVGEDLAELLAMDRDQNCVDRPTYISKWVEQTDTRNSMVCTANGEITGFGTIRACRAGHKIGPVFAPDVASAQGLILSLADHAKASDVQIDIPDPNRHGVELAQHLGLQPVFSCARMYRGTALKRQTDRIFGEVSFELG